MHTTGGGDGGTVDVGDAGGVGGTGVATATALDSTGAHGTIAGIVAVPVQLVK